MSAITRAEDEATDDIAIIQIHAGDGDGDGAELVFEYNGKHIAVSLSPTQSPEIVIRTSMSILLRTT